MSVSTGRLVTGQYLYNNRQLASCVSLYRFVVYSSYCLTTKQMHTGLCSTLCTILLAVDYTLYSRMMMTMTVTMMKMTRMSTRQRWRCTGLFWSQHPVMLMNM